MSRMTVETLLCTRQPGKKKSLLNEFLRTDFDPEFCLDCHIYDATLGTIKTRAASSDNRKQVVSLT